jgi:hypothetical protein
MNSRNVMLATLLALATALPAKAQMKALEQGIEASASTIALPAKENGQLEVRACTECPLVTLQATSATRYFVGRQSLTLAEFAAYLREHPQVSLTVFSAQNTRNLARVKVQGVTYSR